MTKNYTLDFEHVYVEKATTESWMKHLNNIPLDSNSLF